MRPFSAAIPRVALGKLLVPLSNKRLLQQGWSPRCLTTPSPDDQTWGVVKTTAIQFGWFDDIQNKQLPGDLAAKPAIEIQVGDLLMTCAGPRSRCGVPTLVRHSRPRLMMSGKMYRFRPKPGLDPEFLEKWLLSPEAQRRIDEMKTGISDSGLNLTQDRFLQLPVPLPPPGEQRRIVEILEDHLSHLDAASSGLDEADLKIAGWFRAQVDALIWAPGTEQTPVGRLLREPMRNGRSDRASTDGSGTRTLTLTAVTRNDFSDQFTKVTTTSSATAEDLWLCPGDVFVQRSNTAELVGTTARYEGPELWAIFPDLLIRLRPNEDLMDGRLLTAAMRSERCHRTMRARAKGLAGSMPKIDQQTVAETVVPVPDRELQGAMVDVLADIEGRKVRLTAATAAARVRAQALRRALLAAAFEGKLTGRDTDQEVIEEMAAEGR